MKKGLVPEMKQKVHYKNRDTAGLTGFWVSQMLPRSSLLLRRQQLEMGRGKHDPVGALTRYLNPHNASAHYPGSLLASQGEGLSQHVATC